MEIVLQLARRQDPDEGSTNSKKLQVGIIGHPRSCNMAVQDVEFADPM